MIDTSKMKFPMIAIGKCVVGKAEYGLGDVFDAEREKTFNFYLKSKSARPFRLGEQIGTSVATKTDKVEALQAQFEAASPREKLERLMTAREQNGRGTTSSVRVQRGG